MIYIEYFERGVKYERMNIGKVRLDSSIPRIVAILHDQIPAGSLKSLQRKGADIVEARIDLFHSIEIKSIVNSLKRIKNIASLPIIGTIRRPEDGGRKSISDRSCLEIFKAIIPVINCVDIEIDSPIIDEVVNLAKGRKKKVITSYHNFDQTPSDKQLVKLLRKGKAKGGDIIKLAVMSRTEKDVTRLLALTYQHKGDRIITISMGKKGQITRIIAPFFGSLLTYGYIDSPVAPGQFSIGELKKMMNRLS